MYETFEKSPVESKFPPFTTSQQKLFDDFWPMAQRIAKWQFSQYGSKNMNFEMEEFISMAGLALVLAVREFAPCEGTLAALFRKIFRDTIVNSIRSKFRACRRGTSGRGEIPLSVFLVGPHKEMTEADFVVDEKTPPPHHLIDIRDELEFIKTVQVAKSPEISIRNWKIAESYLANEENRSKIPAQVGVGMTRVQQITTSTIAIVRQSPEVAALTVP